ncbi:coiled-coil domain-containing protein 73 isoform X2 [Hippocampus comes]|uniref:coiled-coil domain-containing protein 73 isoform X2 n=1 Tax=Hippocampus comes TaxID=109280 RepID=UPI00094E0C50|nr:PREDICTED: uncharacterized protein LOC109519978 isoform X2 [Hippocampus comes]
MKELEEVNTKVIKTKLSSVRHETDNLVTHKEQHLNQLSYKLSMEKEINKRLREEYAAVRSEKQEVMMSLQHTQQLFLNQTLAVNRQELQLQTQEEQYKALKLDHAEMQERSKIMEEKVAQLMSEQQHFQALKEVHDDLQQKYNQLSTQVKVQKTRNLEMFPSLAEGPGGRPSDEPKSSFTLSVFGSLQNTAVSQSKILDCLEDTSAKTKLDGEMGGQGTPMLPGQSETQLQVQLEEPFSISSPKTLLVLSQTMDSDDTLLNKPTRSSNTNEKLSNEGSDQASHQSANELAVSESFVNGINISNSDNKSSNYILTNDRKRDHGSTSPSREDCCGMDKVTEARNNSDGGHTNESHLGIAHDVLEERCSGEEKEILISQTADRGHIQEYGEAGAHKSKTETTAEFRDGEKDKGKTETEQEVRMTCHIKSNIPPDTDLVDLSEKIGTVCVTDCDQKDTKKVADRSPVNMREGQLLHNISGPPDQSFNYNAIAQVAQHSCQVEVQTNSETVKSSPTATYPVVENTTEVTKLDKSTDNVQTNFSDLLSQSVKNQTMTQSVNITSNVTPTDEMKGEDTNEEVKKTIVDTKVGCLNMNTSEPANGPLEVFESDASKEVCGMTSQAEPVICYGDLNISISNPDIAEDSKSSKSVLLVSDQPKSGNVESPEFDTSKCQKQPVVKETLAVMKQSSLPILKTYRPSFDWGGALKQTVLSATPSDSNLQPNIQSSPVSEQSAFSCGLLTQSPCTFKSQHSKEPLVIISASDLLKASSISASAGFGRKHKLGERNVFGESVRETVATDESRVPLSAPSCPFSYSSSTLPSPSGTSLSAAAPRSDSESETLCSQEEQQSSFRNQISKIEQFLKSERLHLSKRRRTDS